MTHNPHHEHLIKEMEDMLEPIFKASPQAVYVYLDDEHKICNKKFADLLGYANPQEWVDNQNPVGDVLEIDQEKVINAYIEASQQFKASTLHVKCKTKKGETVSVEVIMSPITYKDEVFVIHFISQK